MTKEDEKFHLLIGKAIAMAGNIEGKINCIISDDYLGRKYTTQRALFDSEVLNTSAISFSSKIDILFKIMNRRGLKFKTITPNDLKSKFVKLRNDLAHSRIEYDVTLPDNQSSSVELKFVIRNKMQSLNDKEAEFEKLGMQIALELEGLFADELWGNPK
jgi:hypothetical protein